MLDERDRRAWADLERRLLDDTAPRLLPAARLSPGRSPTPARWLPYVMAVVVPLTLPAVSVMEMRLQGDAALRGGSGRHRRHDCGARALGAAGQPQASAVADRATTVSRGVSNEQHRQ